MAASTDIDPTGDVIFICHANTEIEQRLRVASAALSLGSPVFKSMFSKRFEEGTELATSASVEVPMPDDDYDALEIVCNVLHHRNDAIPGSKELEASLLVRVAETSDKYNCAEALRFAARQWLLPTQHTMAFNPLSDKRDLMTASFYFGHSDGFKDYGTKLVLESAEPIWSPASGDDSHPLRSILERLEAQRIRAQDKVVGIADDTFEDLMDARKGYLNRYVFNAVTQQCTYPDRCAGDLLRQLRDRSLWPLSVVRSRSVRSMFEDMKALEWKIPETCVACKNTKCSLQDEIRRQRVGEDGLGQLVERVRGQIETPCLLCFRETGGLKQAGCKHEKS